MKPRLLAVLALAALLLAAAVLLTGSPPGPRAVEPLPPGPSVNPGPPPEKEPPKDRASSKDTDKNTAASADHWLEDFQAAVLDPARWTPVQSGDFKERAVDVFPVGQPGENDRRLRLRANTLGTDDKTVKFLGVRARPPLDLRRRVEISFELDWNQQANGSYLAAGMVLSPETTDGNAESGSDWLKVEYVGVPPGKNARLAVVVRRAGQLRFLHTEGWPETNRQGRPITRQKLSLAIQSGILDLRENDTLLYSSKTAVLDFPLANLYLQMSSHSNYPARQVYFDNVTVRTSPVVPPGETKDGESKP